MDHQQAAQLIEILLKIEDHLGSIVVMFFLYAVIRLFFKK